jgi:hypothetical protein
MDILITIFKLIVGLSLINVWILQRNKPTRWRGGDAQNITEEFQVYGLPLWSCYVIGSLKVLLGIALIISIWVPVLVAPAAIGLAVLLLGSIVMHLKIKDPLYKSFPAFLFMVLCLFIAFEGQIF